MGKGAESDQTRANDDGKALAVPLDVAAQLLGRPLPELERADVEPYPTAYGPGGISGSWPSPWA